MSNAIPLDALSPAATHVLRINEADAYATIVTHNGEGPVEARDVLETLRPGEVLRGPIADHNAAACLVAGLWLWHDFLDPAHTIVQGIETPTGSLWHAVLHRREGDFANAKYWYRRAGGDHPALIALAARANELTQHLPADKSLLKLSANGWNAMAFVDLCEAVHGSPGDMRHATVVAIQRAEWQSLFAATVREAQQANR